MTEIQNNVLPRQDVIYCAKCGMPPEYCEYGPDFESHCNPWLRQHHPNLHAQLAAPAVAATAAVESSSPGVAERPLRPWTTEERLTAFYEKYVPEKIETVPGLLDKYAGKEDKLFEALVKKYGPEPDDPYYGPMSGSEDESDSEGDGDGSVDQAEGTVDKKKRRGASAKKKDAVTQTKIQVSKVAQKRKRFLIIVTGMETVPGVKLKDAAKAFSKRFAGSSSVKETATGTKEIILQGDHLYDVAEFIADKFGVDASAIFMDVDGEIVTLGG